MSIICIHCGKKDNNHFNSFLHPKENLIYLGILCPRFLLAVKYQNEVNYFYIVFIVGHLQKRSSHNIIVNK